MEPGAEEISAGSNSSGMHSLQCSSQQQVNMHQQQTEEIQQQGEQQHQQLMQEWQQQLEDPSDQQEQFELDQTQHPEQSQLQPYVQNEHLHLEPPQLQQKQQWQPDQQQQLQQVQMQQMLQHTQQQHLQEMHSQQLKLQQSQDQQELVTQLQQQLQPQQQESSSQSEHQDMEVQLQQQELPLQELELQLQEQELALQLQQQQQQQLPPQIPHEHLKQLPQTQQQQLEQSPAEPQQQHLQQLQQSQQHLQQPQQQQHSQHFPVQPQQQYVPQSQQQPQQSSLEPQHQHLQPLSQHQQLPLHSQQQHLPQPQQQTQQQLQLLSQHQQQSQQLPLQSQEQHLPQSQQRPQQQLQQSTLPSQHQHLQQLPQPQQQPQLQQVPLPSQQHLQQLAQSQQQPQQKLQQMSLQQQQQHLQQSQQQAQQHLQQASMSSHQQTQQQMPQPQQQLPHPQQQHLQPLSQPQKQHLQQLPQSQQQRSQQLPQAQQQLQQPQSQQQRSQLQPHLQQLSQSQQQLQQKQLQPQVQQQQQQQLSSQHPSQSAVGQAATSVRGQNISGNHSISFGSLIPMILPHLSKEQSERLQGLYTKLRRNEVTKEDFLRATRNVVGDQMLVQAVRQMQQKHQGQSQLASSSQASQLHQQQQQQQQRQQQHVQGSSQQFMAQQSIHTQQLNEPQPFQQVSPTNLQPQAQRTSDFQPHSQSSAPASLTVSHSSSDNKTQQSRQPGEPHPEISSVHGNQTSTMNLHHVKHEVDRTMIGFPLSSQQQQQHLQVPSSSFPMYGRPPGNYSSQPFSASPGLPPGGVKVLAQDSQPKQVVHPQVGVQAHGGPPQLSNIKNMPKYDLSKQGKRREDEERQKILQSSGAAHFSGQHQPSVWATSLDKEKAGNTGISPSSSVHIKQEISDISDQQLNIQTLQPMKADSVEHQSIKTSGISSVNHPLGSSGLHSDHLMQAPLATSAATLHHTLSGFNGPVQMRPQVPSTPPSSMVGSQIKTPPKKMLIGQKKLFDGSGPSMQLASKKQKVSAGYLDQSIDQLNDVTAVSGVNLREEEEQLFAGPKEESRATEAMRKVVQEEEERIFLQKGSLRAKLDGIMAKYGIKYISSDSERCLSLCVEERLRTMIGHLIRLSKQRVDLERASHKVTITSDVRRQILAMNKKAKDDLEKKQAEEAEKLRKLNEIENVGPEGEKDETRTKAQKAQKEEDDKMRANAANVAARAAVGGDDMLSKWQLMAEQARQKREGTSDGASNTRTNRDANRKSVVGGLKSSNVSDHQDAPSTGVVRNLGRTSGPLSQTKPVRSICIKDVIALLEREPQMTKSTLLYRLYERGVDYSKEKGTEIQNNENTLQ